MANRQMADGEFGVVVGDWMRGRVVVVVRGERRAAREEKTERKLQGCGAGARGWNADVLRHWQPSLRPWPGGEDGGEDERIVRREQTARAGGGAFSRQAWGRPGGREMANGHMTNGKFGAGGGRVDARAGGGGCVRRAWGRPEEKWQIGGW